MDIFYFPVYFQFLPEEHRGKTEILLTKSE